MIMNFSSDGIEEYGSLVAALERGEYLFKLKKLELDINHRECPPAKPSIEEAPKLKLKALPPYLRYVFFEKDDTFPVIIASNLNMEQVVSGISVKEFQRSHWLDCFRTLLGFHLVFFHKNRTHTQSQAKY